MNYDTTNSSQKVANARKKLGDALERLEKNISIYHNQTKAETMLRKDVIKELDTQIDLLDGFIKQKRTD